MSRYIDAEKLKSILRPMEWGTPDERWVPEHEIANMLDFFPAADVQEVRRGHWEDGKCSLCGFNWHDIQYEKTKVNKSPYCPNCGARMEVDE